MSCWFHYFILLSFVNVVIVTLPCDCLLGRRLFQRVIVLSGSALSPWAVSRDAFVQSSALADRLNCSAAATAADAAAAASRTPLGRAGTPDRALVVQCLRRVAVERLVETGHGGDRRSTPDAWNASGFGPTLGGAVLPAASVEQLIHDACDNRSELSIYHCREQTLRSKRQSYLKTHLFSMSYTFSNNQHRRLSRV